MLGIKNPPTGSDPVEWLKTQCRTELVMQGKLCQLKIVKPLTRVPPNRRHTKIMGFSRASRLNLLKKFAVWNWESIRNSLFVTLTYSDDLDIPEKAERNIHRSVMQRHLERVLGRQIPALWRVEYQPRQSGRRIGQIVPHWHVLLLGQRFLHMDVINDLWKRTLRFTGYIRTETKGAKRHQAVWMYIAKYMSKDAVDSSLVYAAKLNNEGRHWMIRREELIPVCERIVVPRLTQVQIEFLRSFASEVLPSFEEFGRQSFTLFGNAAQDAISYFVANYLDMGQEIAENECVKGESADKSVTGQDSGISTPSATFLPYPQATT